MSSKKTIAPSRSSQRAPAASKRTPAPKPARRASVASRAASAPAVKSSSPAAPAAPLAKRALQKVKTKTGLAVVAGVVLAGAAGLIRKYRAAH